MRGPVGNRFVEKLLWIWLWKWRLEILEKGTDCATFTPLLTQLHSGVSEADIGGKSCSFILCHLLLSAVCSVADLCSRVNPVKTEVARGQTLLSVIPVQHLGVSGAGFDHGCTIIPLKSHYYLQRCESPDSQRCDWSQHLTHESFSDSSKATLTLQIHISALSNQNSLKRA